MVNLFIGSRPLFALFVLLCIECALGCSNSPPRPQDDVDVGIDLSQADVTETDTHFKYFCGPQEVTATGAFTIAKRCDHGENAPIIARIPRDDDAWLVGVALSSKIGRVLAYYKLPGEQYLLQAREDVRETPVPATVAMNGICSTATGEIMLVGSEDVPGQNFSRAWKASVLDRPSIGQPIKGLTRATWATCGDGWTIGTRKIPGQHAFAIAESVTSTDAETAMTLDFPGADVSGVAVAARGDRLILATVVNANEAIGLPAQYQLNCFTHGKLDHVVSLARDFPSDVRVLQLENGNVFAMFADDGTFWSGSPSQGGFQTKRPFISIGLCEFFGATELPGSRILVAGMGDANFPLYDLMTLILDSDGQLIARQTFHGQFRFSRFPRSNTSYLVPPGGGLELWIDETGWLDCSLPEQEVPAAFWGFGTDRFGNAGCNVIDKCVSRGCPGVCFAGNCE